MQSADLPLVFLTLDVTVTLTTTMPPRLRLCDSDYDLDF